MTAVTRTIDHLASMPLRHALVMPGIRMAAVRPFPFGVYFAVAQSEVVVLAVLDLRRDPARRARLLAARGTPE